MTLNVLSFWSYKEIVLWATDITSYSNCHFFVAKLPNISLLVKHMIDDSIFKERLGRIGMPNNTPISAFPDLFYIWSAYLSNSITLSKYVDFTRGNWDNFNLDNGYMSDIANNDGPKSELEDFIGAGDNPNDPDKLYGIYDWSLAISAFLAGVSACGLLNSFFFFFSDDPPVEASVALRFRFCFFLAALSIFFFALSLILIVVSILLASLSRAFFAKASIFFISFSSLFFFAASGLAASSSADFACFLIFFSSGVSHDLLTPCGPFITSLHSIFVPFSAVWLSLLYIVPEVEFPKVEFSWSFSLLAKPILLEELFANIDPELDELKSRTISCGFLTLCLFCCILEDTICKGSLVNSKSFNS